jgi:hypothetical protein
MNRYSSFRCVLARPARPASHRGRFLRPRDGSPHGVSVKTGFDVGTLLQLQAQELTDLLHTTKTLRAYHDGKKSLGPAAITKKPGCPGFL